MTNLTEKRAFVRQLAEDAFGGQPFDVGDTVRHPSGRTVKIISGEWWGPIQIINFWEWREVLQDGSLGPVECGTGWDNDGDDDLYMLRHGSKAAQDQAQTNIRLADICTLIAWLGWSDPHASMAGPKFRVSATLPPEIDFKTRTLSFVVDDYHGTYDDICHALTDAIVRNGLALPTPAGPRPARRL